MAILKISNMISEVSVERRGGSNRTIANAGYKTFTEDGKEYFQIVMYGSEEREVKGKKKGSQFIELDRDNAVELIDLLKKEFNIDPDSKYAENHGVIKYPRNRIFFGAPGTGKSHLLDEQKTECLFKEKNVERVTFHPDYSYANFVGTYKPVMKAKSVGVYSEADDREVAEVVRILTDKNTSGQEKYDILFDRFNTNNNLTRLPLLLSLYSVDGFTTRKQDGSATKDNNSVAKNDGEAVRKYVMTYSDVSELTSSEIEYRFIPGPFMRVYTEAKRNPGQNYLLIIEEINRANVAAVFGDVFQLLDRSAEGDSVFPIKASEDVKDYLAMKFGKNRESKECTEISIPSNMYIWATMNSADQGVFPMDTAFKRRWDFKYIGIDDSEEGIKGKKVRLANGTQFVEWNELRWAINAFLAKKKINEDKQLGPYFIASDIVAPDDDEIDSKKFIETFKNKVVMYLYEDAARKCRDIFSDGKDKRYSEICRDFDDKGIEIFDQSIVDAVSLT